MIPYGRQHISAEDIRAVVEVLESDFLTQGPVGPKFEQALCDYTGANFAVATNSATSSLHLACRALGLRSGDVLWTTPITFVASANCALYCGADVDFVDIDPRTFNLSVEALEYKLDRAQRSGKLPKVVIPVHLGGLPCDMQEIAELARRYGFSVIEDASHAIGGRYHDQSIGNCRYSDITVFSFHPVKLVTTGEGGAALTNNHELAEKMALLRSHGITRDPAKMTHKPDGDWYYQQIELGYNYRMTDIQAALGLSQLSMLDQFVKRRQQIAARYDEALHDQPMTSQYLPDDRYSAMHLYIIRLKMDYLRKTHRQIFSDLRAAGIGVNLHYIPLHTHPWYQARRCSKEGFPQAETYYQTAISLPIYPDLTDSELDAIAHTLRGVLQ